MAIKRSLLLAICLCITIETSVLAAEITDNLSDAQIRRIFHRSRDELPDFKTFKLESSPVHRSKRDLRPVEFEIDGEKTKLNLKQVEHNVMYNTVPVWTVKTDYSYDGHSYEKVRPEESKIDGSFYEDSIKMATMLAYYKNNNIYYDGVYGEGSKMKVVRSIVEKWSPGQGNNDNHVVFDVNEESGNTVAIGENNSQSTAEKLDKPLDVLYPKVLAVVTYDYFKALGENVAETVKYVATFWNAVNLKYSKITSPKIKVVVTGIIIAKDETALRYFYDTRKPGQEGQFDHLKMLQDQSNYFVNTFPNKVNFKNYDVTITITTFQNGRTLGSAYPGSVCRSQNNVGFVKDDASFSGVHSATHELGHLLNLPHDGSGKATTCESYPEHNVSTMMAAFTADVEKYVWSKCSKDILHNFAQLKAAECLRTPEKA